MQNVPTSLGATDLDGRRTHFMANQAARADTNHTSNHDSIISSMTPASLPNSGTSTIPINSINPGTNPINVPSIGRNSISQQINHLPATMESYMISPALNPSQPRPSGNSVHQFAIPTLKRTECISAPSVTRRPINSTLNAEGRHVVATTQTSQSQPRNAARIPAGPLSHVGQPVPTTSAGLKRSAPKDNAIQTQHSKKRKTFGHNHQQNSSAGAPCRYQPIPGYVFNSARAGSAAPAYEKDSLRGLVPTQRKPHVLSSQSPNPEEQLSTSDPSMNQRIFISDDIDVSVGEVYTAAASCGYKLTAEQIKCLSKDQILRFLVRARQKVLKAACNLPRKGNGQINVSKQQLDTHGLEKGTPPLPREQAATGTATLNYIPSSCPQIVQHESIPPNREMKGTNTMPRNRNLDSTAYQANKGSQNTIKITSRNAIQECPKPRESSGVEGSHVATRKRSSAVGPNNSVVQGELKMNAVQGRKASSSAPVVSTKRMRANTANRAESISGASQKLPVTKATPKKAATSLGSQLSQQRLSGTQILRNCAPAISLRVTQFQTKYAVYEDLINKTLQYLQRNGSGGQNEALYLRDTMQLLTQPAALGPKLTLDVLNTTENFLRSFLVGCQGIGMKSGKKKSEQTGALRPGGSLITDCERFKSSNAQIGAINQVQIAVKADKDGKDAKIQKSIRSETGPQDLRMTKKPEPSPVFKPKDAKARQKETLATQPTQTSAPAKPVSGGEIQTLTATTAVIHDVNLYPLIAQKLSRVNHYVLAALRATENCQRYLEEESMLNMRDESFPETCQLNQDENQKKAPELKGTANAEEASESSLLEILQAECDTAQEEHKKLLINIVQKWNKPVVECLLAYQCIRLPKIVIHVGGSYQKTLSTSVGFERPPFGWVSVLTDIKKRFTEKMLKGEGVGAVLQAWAKAAEEVLGEEAIGKN